MEIFNVSFIIKTKPIKNLGVNSTRKTKLLYEENYKTLMKEIKDYLNRGRDSPCSQMGKLEIVRMYIFQFDL